MEWTPEWESLADALDRVARGGTPQDVAKQRICIDIAQDHIRIRPYVASEIAGNPDLPVVRKSQYRVPNRLEPGDFDWENSRPLRPWSVNREGRSDYGWEPVAISFIELNTYDVVSRFCEGSVGGSGEAPKIAKNPGGRPRKYNWDDFYIELIRLANNPDGLPERDELNRHMNDWCANNFVKQPEGSQIRNRLYGVLKAIEKS
jgi:hypothetical protein